MASRGERVFPRSPLSFACRTGAIPGISYTMPNFRYEEAGMYRPMRAPFLLALVALAALACGPAAQPAPAAPAPGGDQPRYGGALTARIGTDMFDFDTSYVGQSTPNTWGLALAYN